MYPRRDMICLYISHRVKVVREDGTSVNTYSEPIAVLGSLGSIGAFRAIQLFGEKSGNTYRFIPERYSEMMIVGDRAWIEKPVPDEYDPMASTADYVVDTVFTRSNVTQVTFKKI